MSTKKVLVTGADGFIGSHLTEALHKAGCSVRALAQYNSFNHWGWLEGVPCLNDIDVTSGDVRDAEFCNELLKDIDIVFHLAALIAIPYSYAAPQSYIDTNVSGTLNICTAARRNGVQRIVVTSTSEVYGTAQYVPIDEAHVLQPQSPYSASKISADAIASSFYHSFELPLTIARPFNTYGPRQSARAVIPTIIAQISGGQREIKLGDLSPTRDFNFVADVCAGFLALAQCDEAVGQTVNIGSGTEVSIGDTLHLIKDIMQADVQFLEDAQRLRPPGSEVQRLVCDNRLIKKLTGYAPQHSLRAGLEKTVDWFKQPKNLQKYKADIYNI
ncbi:MAG: NAD-dependent 4,6-dehydratase LegB [Kordiimonadaceae bacterium]|nr:NAD-dependent 4,6-dehydratase LegB [Kordiimonadaceae bacterium]